MIIDTAQHKMISAVLEMLNGLSDKDFEESKMTIEIELTCRSMGSKVVFDDIGGEWGYYIESLDD